MLKNIFLLILLVVIENVLSTQGPPDCGIPGACGPVVLSTNFPLADENSYCVVRCNDAAVVAISDPSYQACNAESRVYFPADWDSNLRRMSCADNTFIAYAKQRLSDGDYELNFAKVVTACDTRAPQSLCTTPGKIYADSFRIPEVSPISYNHFQVEMYKQEILSAEGSVSNHKGTNDVFIGQQ